MIVNLAVIPSKILPQVVKPQPIQAGLSYCMIEASPYVPKSATVILRENLRTLRTFLL